MSTKASTGTRTTKALTAAAEAKLLRGVAARLPSWVLPDHLTLLALVSAAGIAVSYGLSNQNPAWLWGANLGLVLHWFGDSLDGTLARVRKIERPRYGFYVDHVLDVVGATLLFGGMAASGYVTPVVALGVLVAYLLVSAEVFLATSVGGEFRLSFVRVGPTELRILLSIGMLALLRWPTVSLPGLGPVRLLDVGGVAGIAGLSVALVVSAVATGRRLYAAEPLPR